MEIVEYHCHLWINFVLLVSNLFPKFLAWSEFIVEKLALVFQSSVFKRWTVITPKI